ncbi:MAG: aryl-sulfate sulfotransferase [Planctomycetes bacterium]|nr:aryl-sulfate sulfotransferase [Planctomycetota bacterium]
MTRLHSLVSLSLASLPSLLSAQSPADGMRLIVPIDQPTTYLVDVDDVVVHSWPSQYLARHAASLDKDGSLVRSIKTAPGFHDAFAGGGFERVALDGTSIFRWHYYGPRNPTTHHDIEILPNGNVLMIAYEEYSHAEAVAHGRHPALMDPTSPFRPDHIIEVQQTSETDAQVVWEWHVWDHVIQDVDPTKANFGVVADNPQLIDLNYPILAPAFGDWNHMNSVDYDPVHDWIIISPRGQNEMWIIDHSTTTAEAAGHTGGNMGRGGDLLYRWGNPAAHRRGTPADQKLFGQHGPVFIPEGRPGAGNVLVFNNNAPGGSAVQELVLPIDANGDFILRADGTYGPDTPVWSYQGDGFQSPIVSNCERLPNGNTLICSGFQARVFEVTPSGQTVWSHRAPHNIVFQAEYVERAIWGDVQQVSRMDGGSVEFDLIAGSRFAGQPYLVLGSVSGTAPGLMVDGLLLPLNVDSYFMTTFSDISSPLFTSMSGTLDANGRATAYFNLPGGILPSLLDGLQFDHAFFAVDAPTWTVVKVSDAVRFEIVP